MYPAPASGYYTIPAIKFQLLSAQQNWQVNRQGEKNTQETQARLWQYISQGSRLKLQGLAARYAGWFILGRWRLIVH